MTDSDVAVVGGGVIGLAVAWRCAQRGMRVTVYDPEPGSGASTVAAGMLAPVTEAHFGEEPLLRFALASKRRWPAFAAELAAAAGSDIDLGYRTDGTLLVAFGADELREVRRLHEFYATLGLATEWLTASQCRQREPLLSPRVTGGMVTADDHQVDPRGVVAALLRAVAQAGVSLVPQHIDDLAALRADKVVVAAGSWSEQLSGLPVRPVKGQILRLRARDGGPGFRHTVRAFAGPRSIYLLPRLSGEVVAGATVEERGYDTAITAGALQDLLRAAIDVVPEVAEYELVEARAGLRPGTPDNAPLLGATADPRVIAATGHFRQGILLAPLTADTVAELAATGQPPEEITPFAPDRFATRERT